MYLRGLDTIARFSPFDDKRDNFYDLLLCFSVHQAPYEKESTLKGKNLLPQKEGQEF